MFSFVNGAQVQRWKTRTRASLTHLSEPLAGRGSCCCCSCCCHSSSRRGKYSYNTIASGGPCLLRLCLTLLLIVSADCQGVGSNRGSSGGGNSSGSAPAIDLGASAITKKTGATGTRSSHTIAPSAAWAPAVAAAASTTAQGGVHSVTSRRSNPESAKPRAAVAVGGGSGMSTVTALATVFGASPFSTSTAAARTTAVNLPPGRLTRATAAVRSAGAPTTPTTQRQQLRQQPQQRQQQQQHLSTSNAASLAGVSASVTSLAPDLWTLYSVTGASSPTTRGSASSTRVNGSIQAQAVHWADLPVVLAQDKWVANRTVASSDAAELSTAEQQPALDPAQSAAGGAAAAAQVFSNVTASEAATPAYYDGDQPLRPSAGVDDSAATADRTINSSVSLSPSRDDRSSSLDFSDLCPGFRRSVLIPNNCSNIELCEESVIQTIEAIRQKQAEGGFVRIMQQYDCREEFRYSEAVSCDKCLISYQQWLCASHLTVYLNGSPADVLEPCADVCDAVVKDCPYVQPQQGSVEPCFRCRDRHIENDQIQLRPCYSFLTNTSTGADNVSISTYPEMIVRPALTNNGIGIFTRRSSMRLHAVIWWCWWCCCCWLSSFKVSHWLTLSHWRIFFVGTICIAC